MELMVTCAVFLSLLVSEWTASVQAEILHVSWTEGSIAILYCGDRTRGTVTWSRDVNGRRKNILTTRNGETTKHTLDPDRRYGSRADLALSIYRVSESDAGRYYCGGTTVELSVKSEVLQESQEEGSTASLWCGRLTNGSVTWSRDINGQRVDILSIHNGETTKHTPDPDSRYRSGAGLELYISRVSQWDAGRYTCNRTTVELSVTPGEVSMVEAVLMFGGVGLAALMFLLATVAAGRVILHRGGAAGKQAAQFSSSE